MQLKIANQNDINQIIRQVYELWSAGLKKTDYKQLFWGSHFHHWSRKNSSRWANSIQNEVVASCKTVKLPFFRRGKNYRVLGLGAIFTAAHKRQQGLASELIKSVVNQAKTDNLDGVLLFSAIDKTFYNQFGFENLGSLDFEIHPEIYSFTKAMPNLTDNFHKNILLDIRSTKQLKERHNPTEAGNNVYLCFSSFEPWFSENELLEILRCYTRWLARQPYGIMRNRDYFSFQLARFLYFANYSTTNKANWFLTILKELDKGIIGYVITECSGTSMRILELIGSDLACATLWQSVIKQAQELNLNRICGFESVVKDFIPHSRLDNSHFAIKPAIHAKDMQCYDRLWSQPMFLALNSELEDIFMSHPCPLLEFDYF